MLPLFLFRTEGMAVAIPHQFGYVLGGALEAIMRHVAFVSIVIAGLLALPAAAQQTLPRPPSQMPPPGSQQKGPPPAAQGQKGAPPQQQAQPPTAPPAPFAVLTVAPPKPNTDPSLAAFRKDLAAIAQRKDRPALAKHVLVQGFFWLKEEGNAAGKKTGIEALATALSLAAKDGSGWESLGEFVADETAQPYPDRPNTVCSPAGPEFNPARLLRDRHGGVWVGAVVDKGLLHVQHGRTRFINQRRVRSHDHAFSDGRGAGRL